MSVIELSWTAKNPTVLYSLVPQREGTDVPRKRALVWIKCPKKNIFALLIVIEIILDHIGELFGTRFLAQMCL